MAARHRSLETSMRYRGDALCQREVARRNIENLDSIIPTWTPSFLQRCTSSRYSDCLGKYESFYELHEQFLTQCGLPNGHSMSKKPITVPQKILIPKQEDDVEKIGRIALGSELKKLFLDYVVKSTIYLV